MGFSFTNKGDWGRTRRWLLKNKRMKRRDILAKYGDLGVEMLANATPKDSGTTSDSWYYQITDDGEKSALYFCNNNVNQGVPIAIILQYGHGTGTGGWVEGRDYINPAIQPIFDALADSVWKEVTSD